MNTLTEREKQLTDMIREVLPDYQDAVAAYVQPLEDAAGGPTAETLAIRSRLAAHTAAADAVWKEITGKPLTLTQALAELRIGP